jgi:spore coat protein U-like protein
MCAGNTDGAGHFTGAGYISAKSLGISIKILQADAQSAIAHGDYSDTVTLTLNY